MVTHFFTESGGNGVMQVSSFFIGEDDPGLSQDAQVFRNIVFRGIESGGQLFHGVVLIEQQADQFKARGVGERLQEGNPIDSGGHERQRLAQYDKNIQPLGSGVNR